MFRGLSVHFSRVCKQVIEIIVHFLDVSFLGLKYVELVSAQDIRMLVGLYYSIVDTCELCYCIFVVSGHNIHVVNNNMYID